MQRTPHNSTRPPPMTHRTSAAGTTPRRRCQSCGRTAGSHRSIPIRSTPRHHTSSPPRTSLLSSPHILSGPHQLRILSHRKPCTMPAPRPPPQSHRKRPSCTDADLHIQMRTIHRSPPSPLRIRSTAARLSTWDCCHRRRCCMSHICSRPYVMCHRMSARRTHHQHTQLSRKYRRPDCPRCIRPQTPPHRMSDSLHTATRRRIPSRRMRQTDTVSPDRTKCQTSNSCMSRDPLRRTRRDTRQHRKIRNWRRSCR